MTSSKRNPITTNLGAVTYTIYIHELDGELGRKIVRYPHGTVRYYIWGDNGTELDGWLAHNTIGPSVKYHTGGTAYHQYDKLHRKDGPAITNHNGLKHYFVRGVRYTETEYNFWFPQ